MPSSRLLGSRCLQATAAPCECNRALSFDAHQAVAQREVAAHLGHPTLVDLRHIRLRLNLVEPAGPQMRAALISHGTGPHPWIRPTELKEGCPTSQKSPTSQKMSDRPEKKRMPPVPGPLEPNKAGTPGLGRPRPCVSFRAELQCLVAAGPGRAVVPTWPCPQCSGCPSRGGGGCTARTGSPTGSRSPGRTGET